MTRPNTRPRPQTTRPRARRFQPLTPRKVTLLKSGRTRLSSPLGSSACALMVTKSAHSAAAALTKVRLNVDVIDRVLPPPRGAQRHNKPGACAQARDYTPVAG